MTFTSFEFLLFFPVVVVLYNLIPEKARVLYLLVVSYIFYALMQPVYLALLVLVTLTTYYITKWMKKTVEDKNQHRIMILGIVLVLLPLFFFKYFNFINETIESSLSAIGIVVAMPKIAFMLPVGISFYTFMAVGYIIDVYEEKTEMEPNILKVGLFLSFFPIVLSGPIERAGNMFPQFKELKRSSYSDITTGLKFMLWGYFMKLCVADRLGIYFDAVYGNFLYHNGTSLAFATLLYPFQVYADLGGYSLIAIGTARCMGLKIIPNFKRPFFATTMSELWRRWHMSLIQWLTDYVYTPLSFSLRKWGIWGIVTSLMLTFFISGVWHGAEFAFIVWGLIQGVFLCTEALMQKKRTKFEQKYGLNNKWWYILLCCTIVFILFAFSQIFGNCNSVGESMQVVKKIFTEPGALFLDWTTLGQAIPMLLLMFFIDLRDEYFPNHFLFFNNRHIAVRFFSYMVILLLIISMGVLDSSQFIYFQF